MDTGIQAFYKDKVVFLTGATGFLGKVIIEKLLRTTDVKRIYSMVRPKRGQDIQERIETWQKEPLFEVLLKSKPEALKRIATIAGDCLEPDLGISESDRQLLASEVQIVLHGAATVRFNEPLHVALAINTRATRLMLQLAKEMKHLEAYLHISTAFSNCVIFRIEEKFYPEHLTCDSEKVLAMSELLGDQMMDSLTPTLLGSYPNTYTYTKALAEDVILREAGDLPLSVFRPAIIIASHREPVAGWIDNLYGPIALIYGVSHGVLRVISIKKNGFSNLVPVDYCANVALASIWQTSKDKARRHPTKQKQPAIYTLAPNERNPLSNTEFVKFSFSCREAFPLVKMIWYPFLHCISTPYLYPLAAFFYHTLPGIFYDLALRVSGRKPRLVKLYRSIHINISLLTYFLHNSFYFETKSTDRLRALMSPEDQRIYNFDMEALVWKEYFQKALFGMRLYLGKEPPTQESVDQGRRLLRLLKILHFGLMTILLGIAGIVLWSLIKLII
ncbi:fatty acyl-CoA reductase wat [Drosophila gunungcola]|uniref:fatty acyl-CoA reductase wat n=1 Tax=Drosophila gunungcola TaxID=103775 RepID=UPI0022E0B0FD|nr:fatty acyl-CoA reductase wat [Drosophila gunungcola]XP_052858485.1 fatty acyl-CoA reductase wat [Drosophila gunungcola]